jgi:hypothetical protein
MTWGAHDRTRADLVRIVDDVTSTSESSPTRLTELKPATTQPGASSTTATDPATSTASESLGKRTRWTRDGLTYSLWGPVTERSCELDASFDCLVQHAGPGPGRVVVRDRSAYVASVRMDGVEIHYTFVQTNGWLVSIQSFEPTGVAPSYDKFVRSVRFLD